MKNRFTFMLAGMLLLSVFVQAQNVEAHLQSFMDSLYSANPTSVGMLVHIETPDLSWSGASGLPYKEADTKLEPDQPFLIASNIKTYVSATILRLVEQGKLSIDSPIKKLLTAKTRKLFQGGGYDLGAINIKHLLSHTSGIQDYANQAYIDFIDTNKQYRWTRDEQLALTIKTGPPLGAPGVTFNYADANYLLATEIIEGLTGKPFYTAMRELLRYETLSISDTWFPTLEEKPEDTKTLVHQYWGDYGWDSHDIDVSVDLYGGGGIACTADDLARFMYALFNYEVVRDTTAFNLIYTAVPTQDTDPGNYRLGIWVYEHEGVTGYGHSGFWGTIAFWFPELQAALSVCVLEKDQGDLHNVITEEVIRLLNDNQ